MFFHHTELNRLFQLGVFDKLSLRGLDICTIPAFSAKVNVLEYNVDGQFIEPREFRSMPIVAKDLSVSWDFEYADDWDKLLIAFLSRVAVLGHLERFSLELNEFWRQTRVDRVTPIRKALARAVKGNLNLTDLDLSDTHFLFDCADHVEEILQAMEAHKELHTVILCVSPSDYLLEADDDSECAFGTNFSSLVRLLSRNRKITVYDCLGFRCSNGTSIEDLYLLNGIYNGAATLVKESASLRPLLVATAIVKSASEKFPHIALLASNNMDILCELLHHLNLGEVADFQAVPEGRVQPASSSPNATAVVHMAKKARNET